MTLNQYIQGGFADGFPKVMLSLEEFTNLGSTFNREYNEDQTHITVNHYPEYHYIRRGNSGQLWFAKEGKPTAPSCFFLY